MASDRKKNRKRRAVEVPTRGLYYPGYWVAPIAGYSTVQGCISEQQFGGYADGAAGSDSSTGAV